MGAKPSAASQASQLALVAFAPLGARTRRLYWATRTACLPSVGPPPPLLREARPPPAESTWTPPPMQSLPETAIARAALLLVPSRASPSRPSQLGSSSAQLA